MPSKPKRPCSHPGCPLLTDSTYCPEHHRQAEARYNRTRDPAARKRYGKEWPRIRKIQLAGSPLCEMCLRHGFMTAATEVHHIQSLIDGGTHDAANLMSICKPCHSRITLSESHKRRKIKG